jgi:hypothetical protein
VVPAFVGGLVAAAVAAEGGARLLDLDVRMVRPLLFYLCSDLEVHAWVDDPDRVYGPRPGARHSYPAPGGEEGAPDREVGVNALGFRDPERTRAKPAGTVRIVAVGCSNTYGARVSDGDTWPALLERALNERGGPIRYEVWNAGVPGYQLSQEVAWARRIVADFDPDALVIQTDTIDRRPFLGTRTPGDGGPACSASIADLAPRFRSRPGLFLENLHDVPFADRPWGLWLFDSSAVWRAAVAAWNRFHPGAAFSPPIVRERTAAELQALVDGHAARVRIFLLEDPNSHPPGIARDRVGTLRVVDPARPPPTPDPAYFEIHPPAYVYRWYAERLRDELERVGAYRRPGP